MRFAADIFSILYEAYLFSVFFGTLAGSARLQRVLRLTFYALFAAGMGVLYFFVTNAWIRLAALVFSCAALSFLYDIPPVRRLIGVLFLTLFLTLCELLTGFLLSAVFSQTVAQLRQSIVYYTAGVIVSKSLALLGLKLFRYAYKKEDLRLSPPLVAAVCVFPATSLAVSLILIGGFAAETDPSLAALGAAAIILLTLANIVVYILFEQFARGQAAKSRLELEQAELRLESDYLKELVEKQAEAGKTMHDLKNELFAIRQLLKEDPGAGAAKIDAICGAVDSIQNAVYTGESEVDALINSKVRALRSTSFSCACYISGFGKVDRLDLCVLLGNLLDNAAEACAGADGGWIRLRFLQHGNMLQILLSNTASGGLAAEGALPRTSKPDALAHGFGLKSVKSIAQKYDGDLSIRAEGGVCTVSVLLTSH